jgi:hypothetical protein
MRRRTENWRAYWAFIDFPVWLSGYVLTDDKLFSTQALIGTLWWFLLLAVIARVSACLSCNTPSTT